ncbi:MAG: energy transducer TonB [Bacteroidales bacterium]
MEKSGNKKFLKKPKLDGGKDALKKFINDNLIYPKEALDKNIQGDVIVKYKVNTFGEVIESKVVKGLGHGCDEEALRLVSLIKYVAVNNRGVRITINNKIKIPFRIPANKASVRMSYTSKKEDKKDSKKEDNDSGTSYNYTISY